MLFRVFVAESFADSHDRCGIIDAPNFHTAAEKLVAWCKLVYPCWDVEMVNEPMPDFKDDPLVHFHCNADGVQDEVTVTIRSRDCGGAEGEDIYHIKPVGSDMTMFLAQDWNLVFA